MSASFSVTSSTGEYEVVLGAFESVEDGAYLLADEFFQARGVRDGSGANTVWIEASEAEKSLDRMPAVIEQMRASGANRRTQIVAVGGGVIQDIAAFVASVYMRGVAWTYVPTTVLAMVDSCIGGKSSINVGQYKNLVGTFHPPLRITIDARLADTLPRDQFASGLIEAAKICFCRGQETFSGYLASGPSVTMSAEALEQLIRTSLMAKKWFIEIDEFDKKERLLLNFGHTFGHALEGASHFGIPHGIAVGLGILCAVAYQRGVGVEYETASGVAELTAHLDGLIRTFGDVAAQLARVNLDETMERFASDKKHSTEHFTLIVIDAGGAVVLKQFARTAAVLHGIRDAFQMTIESYTT